MTHQVCLLRANWHRREFWIFRWSRVFLPGPDRRPPRRHDGATLRRIKLMTRLFTTELRRPGHLLVSSGNPRWRRSACSTHDTDCVHRWSYPLAAALDREVDEDGAVFSPVQTLAEGRAPPADSCKLCHTRRMTDIDVREVTRKTRGGKSTTASKPSPSTYICLVRTFLSRVDRFWLRVLAHDLSVPAHL